MSKKNNRRPINICFGNEATAMKLDTELRIEALDVICKVCIGMLACTAIEIIKSK